MQVNPKTQFIQDRAFVGMLREQTHFHNLKQLIIAVTTILRPTHLRSRVWYIINSIICALSRCHEVPSPLSDIVYAAAENTDKELFESSHLSPTAPELRKARITLIRSWTCQIYRELSNTARVVKWAESAISHYAESVSIPRAGTTSGSRIAPALNHQV